MSISRIALLVVAATLVAGQSSFSYDRCDKTTGPSNWSGQCKTGTAGTPINLCGAKAFPNGVPNIALTGYDVSRSVNIVNVGKTVQINIPQDSSTPTLKTTGQLSRLVGRSTESVDFTWNLAQMHMHWGRKDKTNEGSEHYQNSMAYPFEAHFVHFNSKYSTIGAAVASGNADALLVVGVFFEVGSTDLNMMTAMANQITSLTKTDKALASNVRLSEMFDGTGDFWSYGGGLTTPGCNEIVTWIVLTTPKTMTRATLEKFWAAPSSPPEKVAGMKFSVQNTQGVYGNFRPLQPLGSRTLYSSMGNTAACSGNVTDAQWGTCASTQSNPSNSGSWLKPAGLVHFLAVTAAFLISRQ